MSLVRCCLRYRSGRWPGQRGSIKAILNDPGECRWREIDLLILFQRLVNNKKDLYFKLLFAQFAINVG